MKTKTTLWVCILLTLGTLLIVFRDMKQIPYLDEKSDAYFSETITKAGAGYATCRIINASVSVVKESQVQIEPAGLGVSVAAGQALDPLDDMTERASDILATVIVSLGIQKISYELCTEFTPFLLGSTLCLLAVSWIFKSAYAKNCSKLLCKVILLLLAARLCLPVSALTCSFLNTHYFAERIEAEQSKLSMTSPEMEALKDMNLPEAEGVMDNLKAGFLFVGEKGSQLKAAFSLMLDNMGSIIDSLLTLSYLYTSLFILQVIILPLGSFWLLIRLANTLLETKLQPVLSQKELQNLIVNASSDKVRSQA